MRHQKVIPKLGRPRGHRRALLKNLANSLVLYEHIKTTEAKAKILKPKVERLVTRAKVANLHNRRELLKVLPTKNAVKKLFEVIGPKYKERKGGYLRIIKLEPRQGDGAKMAIIEFVG
ncbi:50S ribosomal protein L17 [Candidatus Kuenenbacteria bacterium CG_4_9_14_3_um_filter_39_14]|uniref:Large ribosomal subunit protein bL17 n=6 Tax=Candidatus Kueneniibacteriota TaxID=1752740 RepID=A0A2M7IMN1_9BACT|nr:50S ribosomal protein L17 [Candidatus Kuenenbacteria bacterium]OIP56409.1 MAG: 50S ribosomal protein L17 [Candidatus Kuenenbacteria bacterium CG2_30_39_24]PIP28736.1 MAG: 50S ribosomal protein L17 [Candidatus Kuenenbacteria bacterium CG23_combo_of_CG06-09_8_20_14_all_39_39]PIP75196.1 MAG: 50S ribosomal protein L17 [Candidatus Kuenenbacteria bacterium CG22_combo_CG10-13_8_21_14_all_39_9]PIR80547.1 MAG: 50S ribosomal protein L17 [Candidatus Kuenenbacteria bacterium CG10_big_fil_rev_8_21_14_0_1